MAGQLVSRLLPANILNHTPKSCRREGLLSCSWIFVSGGRSSASGCDLGGQRRRAEPQYATILALLALGLALVAFNVAVPGITSPRMFKYLKNARTIGGS
jgi:peptidoglycan/LPS O-acetylase OafA/YrhL